MPTLLHGPRLEEAALILLGYAHLTDPCLKALMDLLAMLRPLATREDAPSWTPMGALAHWLG
eukprot:1441581-Amphidinium_carterae.1